MSWSIMHGHTFEYILLLLSFIGCFLATAVTAFIIGDIFRLVFGAGYDDVYNRHIFLSVFQVDNCYFLGIRTRRQKTARGDGLSGFGECIAACGGFGFIACFR